MKYKNLKTIEETKNSEKGWNIAGIIVGFVSIILTIINSLSESVIKTLKYRREFLELFGSIEDSRLFFRDFFSWYNTSHKHSGIAMLTPENVHYDNIEEIVSKRQIVMNEVYKKHSQRFVKGITIIKKPDAQVWINKPQMDGLPLRSVA